MDILPTASVAQRDNTHKFIYYMQRKHYTLISVGPLLVVTGSPLATPQALYHLHHGLVIGPALKARQTLHGPWWESNHQPPAPE